MADPVQQQAESQGATQEASEFTSLMQGAVGAKTEEKKSAVAGAVSTLAEMILHATGTAVIPDDAVKTIEALIAEIDARLTTQVNAIIHHPDFQRLEGTWRGLHHLVSRTETDETLKIKVLNIPKTEAAKVMKRYKGAAWDQSPLFKKIYGAGYDQAGGHPYGALVGDYEFDHQAPDMELVEGMAQIAAAAHAPFIASPSPGLFGMDSWRQLADPRDLTRIFEAPEYARWRSFRQSEDARYVGMCMPRFLSRLPYGAKTNPVEEFAFEEDTSSGDHSRYTWSNSAFAMAANITRSFKQYGWCSRIRGTESGGQVEGLPTHTFPTDDGGVDMKCPTEISIGDRREAELSKNGFLPLVHYKNTDFAVFMGAQSAQKPQEFDDPDATANANLSARLPYLFATCRFAHYLKCIVRDKIGSFKERGDMENWLNRWITQYVTTDPTAGEEVKARYPLGAAEIRVEDVEGNPGYYSAKFFLRPHYQLEGLTVSLRLVSKLPSAKAK